jgi:uncharacterized NAD(P)/FAD-binding protein YdhS
MTAQTSTQYDLAIIGGGLSGGLLLVHLLELRGRQGGRGRPLRIAWVDGTGEFGCGLPYGRLAHPKFLLNNAVSEMNVGRFHAWLTENHDRWMETLRAAPDTALKGWITRHAAALQLSAEEPQRYLPMYLPRRVFGEFVSDWVQTAVGQAGPGTVIARHAQEATGAQRRGADLHVQLADSSELPVRMLVLALGSLPPDPCPSVDGVPGFFSHTGLSDGGAEFQRTVESVFRRRHGAVRVLIMGSHASAMESLYTIAHDTQSRSRIGEIIVVSPSGRLPQPIRDSAPEFLPRRMVRWSGEGQPTAAELSHAAQEDFAEAVAIGVPDAVVSAAIGRVFRNVFPRLALPEKQRFVEEFGAAYTALNRHTPPDYEDAGASLTQAGLLRVRSARVTSLAWSGAEFEAMLSTEAGPHRSPLQADIVLNCRGAGLLQSTANPLIRSVLASGLARINRSGQGVQVNEHFAASPGVYVLGQLLAGMSTGEFHLWNLERAERIEGIARHLAARLDDELWAVQEPGPERISYGDTHT